MCQCTCRLGRTPEHLPSVPMTASFSPLCRWSSRLSNAGPTSRSSFAAGEMCSTFVTVSEHARICAGTFYKHSQSTMTSKCGTSQEIRSSVARKIFVSLRIYSWGISALRMSTGPLRANDWRWGSYIQRNMRSPTVGRVIASRWRDCRDFGMMEKRRRILSGSTTERRRERERAGRLGRLERIS